LQFVILIESFTIGRNSFQNIVTLPMRNVSLLIKKKKKKKKRWWFSGQRLWAIRSRLRRVNWRVII